MSYPFEPSGDRLSNESGTRLRQAGEPRSFPRCEPALTHFELGASQDSRPTAALAKRYTPRMAYERNDDGYDSGRNDHRHQFHVGR